MITLWWIVIKVSGQTLFKLAFEEHLSDTRMRFLNTTSTRAATSCPVASEASEVSADLSAFVDRGVWTVRSRYSVLERRLQLLCTIPEWEKCQNQKTRMTLNPKR